MGRAEVSLWSFQERFSSKLRRGGERRLDDRCLLCHSLCEGKFTGGATLMINLQVELRIGLQPLWFCWECIACLDRLRCIGHSAYHCCKPSAWTFLSCLSPPLGLSWKGERGILSLSSTFGWTAKKSKQNWPQTQQSFAEVSNVYLLVQIRSKTGPLKAILGFSSLILF